MSYKVAGHCSPAFAQTAATVVGFSVGFLVGFSVDSVGAVVDIAVGLRIDRDGSEVGSMLGRADRIPRSSSKCEPCSKASERITTIIRISRELIVLSFRFIFVPSVLWLLNKLVIEV